MRCLKLGQHVCERTVLVLQVHLLVGLVSHFFGTLKPWISPARTLLDRFQHVKQVQALPERQMGEVILDRPVAIHPRHLYLLLTQTCDERIEMRIERTSPCYKFCFALLFRHSLSSFYNLSTSSLSIAANTVILYPD